MKKLFFLLVVLTWVACDNTAVPGTTSPSVIGETDSLRFEWIGDFAAEPYVCDAIHEYDAYRNTTDGAGYFCDGTAWRLIAQDGVDGSNGSNGVSIQWLGSFATAPTSPTLNQAYYNTTDGNSYIYNGTAWVVLAPSKYIKVVDANSNYLGLLVGDTSFFTSKGYLLMFEIWPDLSIKYNNSIPVYYATSNCTGTAYVQVIQGSPALIGALIYNATLNQFYARKNTTATSVTVGSEYNEEGNNCTTTSGSDSLYEYDPISRVNAGIPTTVTAPFTLVQ